jgi:branched-chain amino acid transport system substrate-binding protein
LIYNPASANEASLLDQISKTGVNCILLLGKRSVFAKLQKQMDTRKMKVSLYGSLSFLGDEEIANSLALPTPDRVEVPTDNWSETRYKSFSEAYQNKFGSTPNALASYAYDGMSVIIEAIKKTGTDRENIQKSISSLHYEGVTGSIRFDSKGNRVGN